MERSVCLDQVLHEALDLMAATLPKTIEVERRSLATGAVVRADEAQMHQLITGCVVNAAQAIGREPVRIAVELEETEVGPTASASSARRARGLLRASLGRAPMSASR